jgi:outer membrane protein
MKIVMKKIFFVFLLTGIISATQVKAQESLFSIEYSMGFGSGDLKDFVGTASFRGMSFEYRYLVQPAIGIGFETGYNLFYEEKPYATYTKGAQAISGYQFRYLHAVPVLAAADYYFKPDTKINPFVGLGLGTIYINRDVDMGMYTIEDDDWQFALRPQVGTVVTMQGIDLMLAAKYMMGFKTNDMEANNYFTVNVGIIF